MSALSEAIAAGQIKFHSRPCKFGHGTEKYVSTTRCVVCCREGYKKWSAKNPERVRQLGARSMAIWRRKNPELARARVRAVQPAYYRRNKARYAAHMAAYDAAKINRTPPWADLKKIEQIYKDARAMTEMMDESWHVDHIIPLRGKRVSGLHVHNNLQLLPALENVRKNNQFEDA